MEGWRLEDKSLNCMTSTYVEARHIICNIILEFKNDHIKKYDINQT